MRTVLMHVVHTGAVQFMNQFRFDSTLQNQCFDIVWHIRSGCKWQQTITVTY